MASLSERLGFQDRANSSHGWQTTFTLPNYDGSGRYMVFAPQTPEQVTYQNIVTSFASRGVFDALHALRGHFQNPSYELQPQAILQEESDIQEGIFGPAIVVRHKTQLLLPRTVLTPTGEQFLWKSEGVRIGMLPTKELQVSYLAAGSKAKGVRTAAWPGGWKEYDHGKYELHSLKKTIDNARTRSTAYFDDRQGRHKDSLEGVSESHIRTKRIGFGKDSKRVSVSL